MAEVEHKSHRHEGVMIWLLANPHRTLGECATELGYTQAWLSQLIRSDMFQQEYRRRAAELGVVATHTIGQKLNVLAAETLDEMIRRVRGGTASDALVSAGAKTALSALGYGPQAQAPQVTVNIPVNVELLQAARERVLKPSASRAEVTVEIAETA